MSMDLFIRDGQVWERREGGDERPYWMPPPNVKAVEVEPATIIWDDTGRAWLAFKHAISVTNRLPRTTHLPMDQMVEGERTMSYTPGPWVLSTKDISIVRPDIERNFYSVEDANGEPLGVYPFTEADARLIAAAPEMYEALEAFAYAPWVQKNVPEDIVGEPVEWEGPYGYSRRVPPTQEWFEKARNALSKARGETP